MQITCGIAVSDPDRTIPIVLTGQRDRNPVHYPIPPHLSDAYGYLGYKPGDFPITEHFADTVISLPLYEGMTDEEIDYVVEVINRYE